MAIIYPFYKNERKGSYLKKVLLIILSGCFGLAGCAGFPPPGNLHRFYTSLHQDYQASLFAFADHLPLNLDETSQDALESSIQPQEESARDLSAAARDVNGGEEEALFLAEERIQNSPPSYTVALLSPPVEKDISAADPFPPAVEELKEFPEKKMAPTVSPSEFSPERSAAAEDVNPGGEISFHELDAAAEEGLLKDLDRPSTNQAPEPASTLSAIFPSELNEKVSEFIAFFQQRAESFFSKALARSQAYEEMMKKIFREKNLPEELFYLALIESGYNPQATSRSKAGGIWQFLTKTAKRFGLKVDKWVDERRDPEKSTYAAAEYLKSLYNIFNCWDLATASYNAGEGKVLRAIKKTQSQDFWELSRHRYLKQETKRYVPMFLAAVIIAREPQKYGFSNISYHSPLVYEKVAVPPETNLDWIAKISETDPSELRALNPSLRRGKTPPGTPHFEIKIPPGKKEIFEKNLMAYKQSASVLNKKHRVRSGETLASIAKKYRIRCQDLCELNDLSSRSKIKPGMTLLLPP